MGWFAGPSVRGAGKTDAAVGHEGRVRIFDRYLDAKLNRVARRLRPAAATAYEIERAQSRASKVVYALLDEFATTGREGVRSERAEELATMATSGSSDDAAIALGALQSEGILTRELLYLGGDSMQDGFRLVFQAFADYLILRRRLEAVPEPMSNADLRQWLLEDCSWGIVEAAAVSLPELYGVELPDFLGLSAGSMEWPESQDLEERRRAGRARNVFRSVLETLPYRDAEAVTERTVELLNHSLQLVSPSELFRTMFLIAPQPVNRLNADSLHRNLTRFRMPRRDAFFGFATYHEIFDESSPTATLARWAAGGPYPEYDPQVVELSCVPLAWLLSSPNRFMRDWVTKAMVQLLRGHLDVARRLLDRFWEVDDPYVVQRVIVIAYGALMRSNPDDREDAKKLAVRIRKLVFAQPVRADELILDAARGAVEWGVVHKLLPKKALADIKRPYGLAAPSAPPTEATLEKKYGFKEKQPDEESYSTIRFSLMDMGDFGRYVVESGVHNFSRYRYGKEFPEREKLPELRFVKSRWRAFTKTLSATQREDLGKLLEEARASEPPGRVDLIASGFSSSLSEEQSELLRSVWKHPTRRRWRADEYPADRAQRWIFRRTLSLGWTPRLFGTEDRMIGHSRGGREAHKAERWGKKYQWMAYHELLARLADNFQPSRRWDDSGPYEGLHQINGEREIDPSLPPVEYREFAERGAERSATWPRPPVRIVDVAFTNYGAPSDHRSRALLVRGSWLRTFLKERDLELLVASWHERRLLDGGHRQHHPSVNVCAAARIDVDLNISLSDQVRESR